MSDILKSATPMNITKYAISSYAESTDNCNPIYYEDESAELAGYEAIIAPSCFFGQLAFSKIILGQEDYIPTGGVHIKQKYKFFAQVKEGDKINVLLKVIKSKDKKNRDLLEYHLDFVNQDNILVCQSIMINMLNPV